MRTPKDALNKYESAVAYWKGVGCKLADDIAKSLEDNKEIVEFFISRNGNFELTEDEYLRVDQEYLYSDEDDDVTCFSRGNEYITPPHQFTIAENFVRSVFWEDL